MIWYGGRPSDWQLAGVWRPRGMTEGQGRTAASAPGGAGARGAALPDGKIAAGDRNAAGPPAHAAPESAAAGPAAVTAGRAGAHGEHEAPAHGAHEAPAHGEHEAPAHGEHEARAHGEHEAPGPDEEPAAGDSTPATGEPRRVDARRLESALLKVRHQILDAPLFLDAPGVEDARAERRKLLSQIDDYLLPRLRESGSPVLVALVGSTGAGKSTLVNSLVGKQVSNTGIRRPTTNSPVLASHPSEVDWFAENVFLPTLPRVRQQGLAMPGRDGLLVLASSEGMPKGVALLDTPDIDSVVQAHREFAHQFLDASDLWLFMTTSTRYADAAVWELLQYARDRGAALGIVLSRVPAASAAQLTTHFDAMLAANGLGDTQRFVIPETLLTEGRLPAEIYGPIREWLEDTAAREDRRVAVLTQTMSGVLDTFRARLPALASQAEAQLTLRAELWSAIDETYAAGLGEIGQATANGSLLRGEILARWQDFTGTGDLLRMLQVRRGGTASRPRKRRMPVRAGALKAAVRAGLESLVAAVADRAAEDAVSRWRQHPAGGPLLTELSDRASGRDLTADFAAEAAVTFGEAAALGDSGGGLSQPDRGGMATISREGAAALGKSAPDLARRTSRAISSWQDHVMHLVEAENVTKRSIARVVSFDVEPLALVLTIGLLGEDAGGDAAAAGASVVPQHLLASLFGAGPLRDIAAKARADLHARIALLFDEEMLRFAQVIDAAGVPDDTSPAQLRQVTLALETAR
jgi:energy-coupling factor transporter ATP-binding protein EcfA2